MATFLSLKKIKIKLKEKILNKLINCLHLKQRKRAIVSYYHLSK